MQNFIYFHATMGKETSTCYYYNLDTLRIAKTAGEQIILSSSVYIYIYKMNK